MKILKYTKEERRVRKERTTLAKEESRGLVRLNLGIDVEMFARKETAGVSLGAEVGQLNIPRSSSLGSPYRDWKIAFCPQGDNFSLGYFTLSCCTEELNRYVEFKSYSDELVKIILEQPEIRRFSDAAREGMRGILNKFNEDFNRCLQPLSQEKREMAPALVSKEIKTAKLARACTDSLTTLNKFKWIFPLEVIFGKSAIDEAKETLEVALVK